MTRRTATFAGWLHFDDYSVSENVVAIDCKRGTMVRPGAPARSARPFVVVTAYWTAGWAGRGADDIGREFAAARAPDHADGVPGESLEVWSLPVVTTAFDFLITPAGEWPA